MDKSITIIEILRSQILEIHHSLQQSILDQTARKSSVKFKTNETRKVMVRLSVTCIDGPTQSLHIEELSRLLSLAESLKTSFDVLTRNGEPPPAEEQL